MRKITEPRITSRACNLRNVRGTLRRVRNLNVRNIQIWKPAVAARKRAVAVQPNAAKWLPDNDDARMRAPSRSRAEIAYSPYRRWSRQANFPKTLATWPCTTVRGLA